MLSLIQFGLNTLDVPGSLRLYASAFGFRNAGATGFWGEPIRMQDLPPDSRAMIWWLIGGEPFFQVELFQHTRPAQRPLPADWRPCDHGWVRFGLGVADFDRALAGLAENGVSPITAPVGAAGARRVAFRDPYVGVMVEVREAPGVEGPVPVYATSSVSDLEGARRFYGEALGFPIAPLERLHSPEDEALWGLPGARREGFLVEAGPGVLEIVRYDDPLGRPRRADHRSSDAGFCNVAFGAREKAPIAAALAAVRAHGVEPGSTFQTEDLLAAYVMEPEREIELAVIPEALEAPLGFRPFAGFFG